MRVSLVFAMAASAMVAGCGGVHSISSSDGNHPAVCQEQHEMAKNGKVPTGEIAISCPAHGIGYDYR